MHMGHLYDFGILGATPAGLAAAYFLAAQGRSVAIFDSPRESVESSLADWAPADFFHLSHLPKSLARACNAVDFRDVVYHNTTLDGLAEYRGRKIAGYFLQQSQLIGALLSAAVKAGAKIKNSTTTPAIALEEDAVQVVGSTQLRCQLLIIAQNRPEDIITELSLPVRSVPQSPIVAAALDIPLAGKAKAFVPSLHVVQSPQRGELGMFFVIDNLLHLRLVRSTDARTGHAAELSSMVSKLQKAGLLPFDLMMNKARGAVWRPPAGVALELETHVAKRCLLTGTAGGFADSITGGTLTPTVKSALLAAEVALHALGSKDPQDALMQYKMSWRKSLADFLRPPNTSLSMLMPLLFVNNRIVSKFTEALLHGESI